MLTFSKALLNRISRAILSLALGLAMATSLVLYGKRRGKQEVIQDLQETDTKSAKKVEQTVEKALARNAADKRPVDYRLRSKGKLRD